MCFHNAADYDGIFSSGAVGACDFFVVSCISCMKGAKAVQFIMFVFVALTFMYFQGIRVKLIIKKINYAFKNHRNITFQRAAVLLNWG